MTHKITSSAIFNLFGQVLPAVVLFVTTPILVKGLGIELYGIFAIITLMVDYFSVFDVGMGAAATKYVAEALAKNDFVHVSSVYKTSVTASVLFSFFAAAMFYISIPFVGEHFIKISSISTGRIQLILQSACLVVLFILLKCMFRGVLEAYQRFDIINFVLIPSSIITQLAYALIVKRGGGLLQMVFALTLREACMVIAFWYYVHKILPKIKADYLPIKEFWHMLKFGGYLSITRLIGWFMNSFDKVMISSVLTTGLMTYYIVPFGAATKIGIIAGCIAPVMLPISSQLFTNNKSDLLKLSNKALAYTVIIMGLPTLLLIFFAQEIMLAWMGASFFRSIVLMQILAAGTFFSSLSMVQGSLIQGTGHAKAVTLTGIVLLPLELLGLYFLARNFGLVGAAVNWTILRCVTVFIFTLVSMLQIKIFNFTLFLREKFLRAVLAIVLLSTACLFAKTAFANSIIGVVLALFIFLMGYIGVIFYYCSDLSIIQKCASKISIWEN